MICSVSDKGLQVPGSVYQLIVEIDVKIAVGIS